MRMVSFFAELLVAAMGTTAPGCLWSGDDAEPFGRICASPSEGGEFCVRAEDGPERAWSDAEAHGSLPIQMWAEQPAEMTLDALVKSKPDLERWFATIDAIVDYMGGGCRTHRSTAKECDDKACRGATITIRDKGVLAREEVLAALALGPDELLEALEAAAIPDEEWLAVEPLALHALESEAHGAHTVEVHVFTEPHVRFIQQHAPFQVHRLPNGGVLLATHPYRTLWKLWTDALLLLGIRTHA